ncbi:hypothetical protein [Anaeromyxobacter oryzae]|uniref:Lipoprotein n=1 Tax=Anaeromyxobacter oryzae TaxID=2918170 RepID=A0ABN6MXU7_9BACT|nr:hypothetical protein [Anaeromyxobacter oryzae]BDG05065.1 hypothetical protein AMOR_40610 [Anaeromyxobacter oryzae]
MQVLNRAIVLLTVAAALSCGSSSKGPQRIEDVVVPAGFAFDTSRPVIVEARVADGIIGSDASAAVIVTNVAGEELYRRPIRSGVLWRAHCAVATTQNELRGRLLSASGERDASAEIKNDGSAILEFK